MQAVKGERLQQFLEGRLPYKGRRLSSLEISTKGNKGESSPCSYSQLKNVLCYSFLPLNRNIFYN